MLIGIHFLLKNIQYTNISYDRSYSVSQKIGNQLNLALDLPENVREQTLDLDVGFDKETNNWELIVKYSGDLSRIQTELEGSSVVTLINEYAIITVPENLIERLSEYPEIEFIEQPKRLFFSVTEGKRASCITAVQTATYNLFGNGVLIGIIDSGIDYAHPDFINEDGTSRILALWDQTIIGTPPPGYAIGTLYSRADINNALKARSFMERQKIVPSVDISGHGTHVTCSNGKIISAPGTIGKSLNFRLWYY